MTALLFPMHDTAKKHAGRRYIATHVGMAMDAICDGLNWPERKSIQPWHLWEDREAA